MKTVKATVGAVIFKENKVLLALRDHEPFKDHWCIPGGHIEFGEHPDTAVRREVLEETGLSLRNLKFFNYYSEFYSHMEWHAIALIYTGSAEGELIPQPGEVKELKWVPIKEALTLSLAFNHRECLEDYISASKLVEK